MAKAIFNKSNAIKGNTHTVREYAMVEPDT